MGLQHHPEEWFNRMYARTAVDTCQALRIRYTGEATGSAAAHITVAATTNDITFEQGTTTGAAATSTGKNPIAPVGGTTGVIDMSDASVDTLFKLMGRINLAKDWEAWMVDLRPGNDVEVSAAVGLFVASTDSDCTGANGFALLTDTSLLTAEHFSVGVTFNGPSTKPHAFDKNVLHEILKISAKVTYGGATGGIQIYQCDDFLGTEEQLGATLPLVSNTATDFGTGDTAMINTRGQRIVVFTADASGAITAPDITIFARSLPYGPGIRKSKLASTLGY